MRPQVIGIACIVSAMLLLFWQGQQRALEQTTPAPALEQAVADSTEETKASASSPSESAIAATDTDAAKSIFNKIENDVSLPATAPKTDVKEKLYTIENEFIRVTFSNYGGGIKDVAFIKRNKKGKLFYPAQLDTDDPYIFNEDAAMPALSISLHSNLQSDLEEYKPVYQMVEQKDNVIKFLMRTPEGAEIIRGYRLPDSTDTESEPYIINHQTSFRNRGTDNLNLERIYVNAGTLPPTEGDLYSQYLNFAYHETLESEVEFVGITQFVDSEGFFFGMFGSHKAVPYIEVGDSASEPVSWGGIKNQFFTGIITPTEPAKGAYITSSQMKGESAIAEAKNRALTGYLAFDLGKIAPGEDRLLNMNYYVGPMELARLADLGEDSDRLMQMGWAPIAAIAKVLLFAMTKIQMVTAYAFPNQAWGITIILLTMMVKGLMWPLTATQVRSSRKMQEIQGPLQEIREKFKDNQQKIQHETMKLFKESGVNPAAGCLPLLIQMPIFFGLFFMLRSASELRFAKFLWIDDLSVADTVPGLPDLPVWFLIFAGPLHILPFVNAITMYFQMQMMPTPATDNIQVKMLKFMPFIVFIFTYQFPSGLVLYWSVSNVLTIFQNKVTREKFGPPPTPTSLEDYKKNRPKAKTGKGQVNRKKKKK